MRPATSIFFAAKLALLAACCQFATVAADVCDDGCNTGLCICATPFFTCNSEDGECILGHCTGTCAMAPWLIGTIVGVCALILIGCIWCCCGKSMVETCCQKKVIVAPGGGRSTTAVAVSLSAPASSPRPTTIVNNVAAPTYAPPSPVVNPVGPAGVVPQASTHAYPITPQGQGQYAAPASASRSGPSDGAGSAGSGGPAGAREVELAAEFEEFMRFKRAQAAMAAASAAASNPSAPKEWQ